MSKNTTPTGPVVKRVTVELPYSLARVCEDIAAFHYTDVGSWIAENLPQLTSFYDIDAIRETLLQREHHDKLWRPRPKFRRNRS